MPTWGNTDAPNLKPKTNNMRQVREVLQFTVFAGNTAGNNIISVAYNDGGQNNVANVGVAIGQYVYFYAQGFSNPGGTAGNGYPGMFSSNTQVSAISGNTITLGTNLFGPANVGWGVEFDKAIPYAASKNVESYYNADTVLVTPTRLANNTVALGDVNTGWVHFTKRVVQNGNGTTSTRYTNETLVALANPVASNVNSANIAGTGAGATQLFTGV